MTMTADQIVAEIQALYRSDSMPWIVGYSGGKDSTASLQLVWTALAGLPPEERTKRIYVISTDTLVENPVIAAWVHTSLLRMNVAAQQQGLDIKAERLMPTMANRFWVNLIGKGYPAPRPKFRWCTDRLKISASTEFIQKLSETQGEAILVLGQRRGESQARDKVMDQYKGSTRDRLSKNKDPRLSRVWVYPPIESWTSDDVWEYLMTNPNPWGTDNQELFGIYRGATPDAECPIVVDTSTSSCGDSRFGCYVCTMVSQDKSMQAMIQNDEQKQWMQPILDFRNKNLAVDDRDDRDFRRLNGRLTLFRDELVHGPYTQKRREFLLRELLDTQKQVQESDQRQGTQLIELISVDELDEIRRIWVEEKGEIEDLLPQIYSETLGVPYPGRDLEQAPLDRGDLSILQQISTEVESDEEAAHELYKLTRGLLAAQFQSIEAHKRSRHLDRLEGVLRQYAFRNEKEALEFAKSSVSNEQELDGDASDSSNVIA
ncbi:DNA phosphorothioation system sulfurtransferase DndC [Burkholderia gladioli]|uniref:DNA phosphorothioation system sulfurtransferase DndC n=1 Tax=Burkholderia gladioli TaxID=28095 RepID=UPI00163F1ED8|nr:DNA phosphorothioation system sulfurtransferase DndC [Burkholderia gladioli]